jgi:hypothetical protein
MLNNAMGNMSVQSPPPPPPPPAMTRDVSLVGQPPLIEDLKHQVPMPRIPLNVSCFPCLFYFIFYTDIASRLQQPHLSSLKSTPTLSMLQSM